MKMNAKYLRTMIVLCIISTAAWAANVQASAAHEKPEPVLVGRITYIEGTLLRFDKLTGSRIPVAVESPLGMGDRLRTGDRSRAEVFLPDNILARFGDRARILLTKLTPRITRLNLSTGTARFYNHSETVEISVTTPVGRVVAPPGAVFDLYVEYDGAEVIAIANEVELIHERSQTRRRVRSGSSAAFAYSDSVSTTPGDVNILWSDWNRDMDSRWAARMDARGESAHYLPQALHYDANALDSYGVWESVFYNEAYYRFWRPVQVPAGWAPFSWGNWTIWHGDHVWIPHEPFGYITHHYGNWIFTAGHWYWAPPVTSAMIRARLPLMHIELAWYPGRVVWMQFGVHIGWIPLAPFEPYYAHRHWGPRSNAMPHSDGGRSPVSAYKHFPHAVVIPKRHLYGPGDYSQFKVRHFSGDTLRSKFRATPAPDGRNMK